MPNNPNMILQNRFFCLSHNQSLFILIIHDHIYLFIFYHLINLPQNTFSFFLSFFFTICFSISFPPFFIPSPAAVPGGVSPNTTTQAERFFLSSFGLTGGGKGSKPLLLSKGAQKYGE